MPGFVVNGDIGGFEIRASTKQEYFPKYMWEIDNLFETSFRSYRYALINLLSATLPTFSVAKESYVGGSLEYKFAKSVSWDDIHVQWYDNDGLLQEMRAWRQAVWTPECGLNPANEYKKRSVLVSYLSTGDTSDTKHQEYELINSWPSVIRYGDVSYAESNIKLVEVTVTYDWANERI